MAFGFSFNNPWLLRFALSTYVVYFPLKLYIMHKYNIYDMYIINYICTYIYIFIHMCIYLAYKVVGFQMASSYTLVEL